MRNNGRVTVWSCIQGHQDQQWRYDDDKMTIEHLSRTIPWWAARWGLAHLFRGPSGRCAMAAQGRNGWSVRAGGGISMWPCSRTTPVVNRKFGEIMPGRTEGGSNGVGTWEFPGPPAGKDIRAALGGLTLACPGSKVLTGFSLVRVLIRERRERREKWGVCGVVVWTLFRRSVSCITEHPQPSTPVVALTRPDTFTPYTHSTPTLQKTTHGGDWKKQTFHWEGRFVHADARHTRNMMCPWGRSLPHLLRFIQRTRLSDLHSVVALHPPHLSLRSPLLTTTPSHLSPIPPIPHFTLSPHRSIPTYALRSPPSHLLRPLIPSPAPLTAAPTCA